MLINKIDRNDIHTGLEETECEVHSKCLIYATSTGLLDFKKWHSTITTAKTEIDTYEVDGGFDFYFKI